MWSLDPRTWEWNKVNTCTYLIILNVLSVDSYLPMYLRPGNCIWAIFRVLLQNLLAPIELHIYLFNLNC
jgi:hypothetical protein